MCCRHRVLSLCAALGVVLAASAHPPGLSGGPCRCTRLLNETGWCAPCGIGSVGGLLIPTPVLFEALDAHGHRITIATVRCQGCQVAFRESGFCERCKFGFVMGQLYSSALTFSLARGMALSEGPACAVCGCGPGHLAGLPAGIGRPWPTERVHWCAACTAGQVGNRRIDDRAVFAIAAREFARLQDALQLVNGCETCATAFMMRGSCPRCRMTFSEEDAVLPFVGPALPREDRTKTQED